MLEAHLNPDIDSASRNFKTIDNITNHLIKYLTVNEYIDLLDIGCGPGLYCEKFACTGANVTGLDFSNNSITYARNSAKENSLKIKYINENYLKMNFKEEFDIVTLIYYDFGTHSKGNQELIIQNIVMRHINLHQLRQEKLQQKSNIIIYAEGSSELIFDCLRHKLLMGFISILLNLRQQIEQKLQ